MNLAAILHEAAGASGDRPAIVDRKGSITFGELDAAVAATAAELAAAGVTAGMRVLVLVPMSSTLYIVAIALLRLGATAVFVDPSAGRSRVDYCVRRVMPGACVGVPRAHWLRILSPAVRGIPLKLSVRGWAPGARRLHLDARGPTHDVEPCDPGTPAIITFTSGSTGEPKAAVRTHGFLLAQHRALAASLGLRSGQVDLTTLPVFVLANLGSGVTSIIPDADLRAPGAIDPAPVLAQIRSLRPTQTVAAPALLDRVVTGAVRAGERLDSFTRIFTGGAPVFPRLLDRIAAAAPAAEVVAVYGSTEAEPIAEIERRAIGDDDRRAMAAGAGLLAGRPVPSIDLRILPDRWGTPLPPQPAAEWDRQALAPDTVGEIVVAGAHVLPGYLEGRGDEETKVTVDGRVWHRTGDAGRMDRHGRLWLLGRCSAKVTDADGTVYPFAVECAASYVDEVTRSAFTRVEGRRVLVAEAIGDRDALRHELEMRLAWARLAEIVFLDRIPVDARHNAKVDYPALAKRLATMAGRAPTTR